MSRAGGVVAGGAADVRTMARGWRWGRRSQVPRSAEPYVPEAESKVFDTDWARNRAGRAVREVAQKGVLDPLVTSQVRRRVEGLDILDRIEGPVIFAANHASHLDTPLILLALPDEWRRWTAVAAAADYFFDTWWRAVGSAMVFNTFPIDRRGGRMATEPGEVLAEGWSLVIFPEGTRSRDGWVGRFQRGAAYLSMAYDVPVVPIAHRGTYAAMPHSQNWPSRGRRQLTVRFGEPMRARPEETPRDFTDRIRARVGTLLDEDKTTWWEATSRANRGGTPDPAGPDVAPWRRIWEQTEPLELAPDPSARPGPRAVASSVASSALNQAKLKAKALPEERVKRASRRARTALRAWRS